MIFMVNYPLLPSQISLVSAFTIGIPAFFLALEPNKNIIKGKFLPNVLGTALPAGLTAFIVIAALVTFGEVFGVDTADISTVGSTYHSVHSHTDLYRRRRRL